MIVIEYMLLKGAEFSYDNMLYLMALKAFNGGKTLIYESRYGIFVACRFEIKGKKELNALYRELKKQTGATGIESRYYEK